MYRKAPFVQSGRPLRDSASDSWSLASCRTMPRTSEGVLALTLMAVLVAAALLVVPVQANPQDDEAIMRRLRLALVTANSSWLVKPGMVGWQLEGDPQPCNWAKVKCDRDGYIISITLFEQDHNYVQASATPAFIPLLPELAQLRRLQTLVLTLCSPCLQYSGIGFSAIPKEWTTPGAFKRLETLSLTGQTLGTPLPDIQPGALPLLQKLDLGLQGLISTLPASWGSSPDVLPSLKELVLELQIAGSLPDWTQGFRQLQRLALNGVGSALHAQADRWSVTPPPPDPLGAKRLPAQWAHGFPKLEFLSISNMHTQGSLPTEWVLHGFPELNVLALRSLNLTGPLHAQLLSSHPKLQYLELQNNQFTGTLPPQWALSQVWLVDVSGNNLVGPAFPRAWLNGMAELSWLHLSQNPGLHGSLPAGLHWRNLVILQLVGTGVTGSIPEAWCNSLAGRKFRQLWLPAADVEPTLPACAVDSLSQLKLCTDTAAGNGMKCKGVIDKVAELIANRTPGLRVEGLFSAAEYKEAAAGRVAGSSMGSFQLSAKGTSWCTSAGAAAPPLAALLLVALGLAALYKRQRRQWLLHHKCPAVDASSDFKLQQAERGEPPTPVHLQKGRLVTLEQQLSDVVPQGRTGVSGRQSRVSAALLASLSPGTHSVRILVLEEAPLGLEHLPHSGHIQDISSSSRMNMGAEHLNSHLSPALASLTTWSWPDLSDRSDSSIDSSTTSKNGSISRDGTPCASSSHQWPLPTDSLRMSPCELKFVLDDSGLLVQLGAGSHAAVYLAWMHGIEVAAKVFALEDAWSLDTIWREALITRHCCLHPCTVPLLGVSVAGGNSVIIFAMKLMHGGSLMACLLDPDKRQRLRWAAGGRQVALDIAEGLAHLHSNHVLHSDLKASNVLLSADGRAAISDLGMARFIHTNACTAAGFTHAYAAPEQLLGQRCTLAADMYSFGVLLMELITQQPAVRHRERQLPDNELECPQDVGHLIKECLSPDPQCRPTAAQALARLQATATAVGC